MSKDETFTNNIVRSLIKEHIKKKGKSVVLYIKEVPYRIMRGESGEVVIREVKQDDIQTD